MSAIPSKKDAVKQMLSGASEIVAVGSRSLSRRPSSGFSSLKALALAATLSGAALAGATAINMSSNTGMLNTAKQTTQAQIVAKVWQPGGALLTKSYFHGDDNQVWQPIEDAPDSSRQLILSVDGEPVPVAVSHTVYDQYCKSADLLPRGGHKNPAHLGGCGATHRIGQPAPDHIPLDTLQVTYTRSKVDGKVHITGIEGMEEFATSFIERQRLRKTFEAQKENGDILYRNRHRVAPHG